MISLNHPLAIIYVLSILISDCAADCNDRQFEMDDGRCCDLCPPGTYVKKFCSKLHQNTTVCSPCKEGSFSHTYNMFDRCEECRLCKQDYTEKCTATTNAKCSCRSGFLCSNNMCSKCEENKCVRGEKPLRTGLIEYSYQCKPACLEKEYYDAKMDICKPWTQCNVLGLGEQFPGNKTHNSICYSNDGGLLQVTLGIGFVLLSLTLLMLVSYACIKVLRKHKANNNPIDIVTVSTNTCDFHLSKEESGCQLIIQDESKDMNSVAAQLLEKVNIF